MNLVIYVVSYSITAFIVASIFFSTIELHHVAKSPAEVINSCCYSMYHAAESSAFWTNSLNKAYHSTTYVHKCSQFMIINAMGITCNSNYSSRNLSSAHHAFTENYKLCNHPSSHRNRHMTIVKVHGVKIAFLNSNQKTGYT